jgi:hypothetical protein
VNEDALAHWGLLRQIKKAIINNLQLRVALEKGVIHSVLVVEVHSIDLKTKHVDGYNISIVFYHHEKET